MTKVKLPREVVEAIDELRDIGIHPFSIIKCVGER